MLREGAGLVETAADALLHLGLDPELDLQPHSICAAPVTAGRAAGATLPAGSARIVSIRTQLPPPAPESPLAPAPDRSDLPSGDGSQAASAEAGRAAQDLVKENRASLGTSDGLEPAGNGAAAAVEPTRKLAELLGSAPVSVDELVRRCQMSPPVLRAALLDFELAGRLERHPGDRVSLLSD